jgi:hypothetical protein
MTPSLLSLYLASAITREMVNVLLRTFSLELHQRTFRINKRTRNRNNCLVISGIIYKLVPIWMNTDRVTSCNVSSAITKRKWFALIGATFVRLISLKNPIPLLPAALTHEKMTMFASQP